LSGIISLLENTSYHELNSAVHFQLSSACRLVLGAKLRTVQAVEAVIAQVSNTASIGHEPVQEFENVKALPTTFRSQVLLVPLMLPQHEHECQDILKTVQNFVPFKSPVGFGFVLFGDKGFSPDSLLDPFWPEFLDHLYEFGVPSFVNVWHRGNSSVENFQLFSSISSLFRELDSLAELKAFGKTLADLESQIELLRP
jgi:hypothetical protein